MEFKSDTVVINSSLENGNLTYSECYLKGKKEDAIEIGKNVGAELLKKAGSQFKKKNEYINHKTFN